MGNMSIEEVSIEEMSIEEVNIEEVSITADLVLSFAFLQGVLHVGDKSVNQPTSVSHLLSSLPIH